MANLPAFCDNCGLIFRSAYGFGNATGVTIVRSTQECPNCGAAAGIPDGTYDVQGDVLRLVAGPASSRERLRRYRDLLVQIVDESHTPDELGSNLRRKLPDVADVFEKYMPKHRRWLLMLFVAVLNILLAMQPQRSGPSVSEIEEALGRALGRYFVERSAE